MLNISRPGTKLVNFTIKKNIHMKKEQVPNMINANRISSCTWKWWVYLDYLNTFEFLRLKKQAGWEWDGKKKHIKHVNDIFCEHKNMLFVVI